MAASSDDTREEYRDSSELHIRAIQLMHFYWAHWWRVVQALPQNQLIFHREQNDDRQVQNSGSMLSLPLLLIDQLFRAQKRHLIPHRTATDDHPCTHRCHDRLAVIVFRVPVHERATVSASFMSFSSMSNNVPIVDVDLYNRRLDCSYGVVQRPRC